MSQPPRRTVSILGATGSIGQSTVAVLSELRDRGDADITVEAVTGGANVAAMLGVITSLQPRFVAMASPAAAAELRTALGPGGPEIAGGQDAVTAAAERTADWVMAAIVGAAGLEPTCAALRQGAHVAVANKECLVCAGPLVLDLARAHGAKIIPVDSEHNAVLQATTHPAAVASITLTASGGPFRRHTRKEMASATPAEACKHPNWAMGRKISVDSATLMNKGLELIEAGYLFDLPEEQIELVVHPQSIVHALVHYSDGSSLAQLAAPDMRIPIAFALSWPDRFRINAPRLDLASVGRLEFEPVDQERFPAPALARSALRAGAGATAALNAANEVAVSAFLQERIGLLDIAAVASETLETTLAGKSGLNAKTPTSFAEVRDIDAAARRVATTHLGRVTAG